MQKTTEGILLIAYKFPPYAGVGGYRWAQLCQYLARLGRKIDVVTVEWQRTSSDTLLDMVQHPNIHIHRIPSGYLQNLAIKNFNSRILNGIRNKVFLHIIDKFYPLDFAEHWGAHLIPYCKRIIYSKKITTVIATGHPFMANVHAATLKKELQHIILIQDFRDMWYNDRTLSSSASTREKILQKETFALQTANAVVTVSEGCKKILQQTAGTTPVYVIPNGYDPEKFSYIDHSKIDRYTNFVYLGGVSNGREDCAVAFLDFLRFFKKGKAFFAGSIPPSLLKKYGDLIDEKRFLFLGKVSHLECIHLLKQANFALHFNAKIVPEAASTKIYEYAASGCPVLSFHFGGEPERIIKKHHLGISINIESTDYNLNHISDMISAFDFKKFLPHDIEKFSFPNLANSYINLIETLNTPRQKF